MLKIRDDVNLKELEKLGFEHKTIFHDYSTEIKADYYRYEFEDEEGGIDIFTKDTNLSQDGYSKDIKDARVLYIHDDWYSYIESPEFYVPNIFYDLVKADMVEKVVEE